MSGGRFEEHAVNNLFKFGEKKEEKKDVRVVMKDGDPWFVLKDICAILGIKNPGDVYTRLDEDEKGFDSIDTLGGVQKLNTVNESGLYSVIMGSRSPKAKPFQKWVTGKVLPSIRKTGAYQLNQSNLLDRKVPMLRAVNLTADAYQRMGIDGERSLMMAIGDTEADYPEVTSHFKRLKYSEAGDKPLGVRLDIGGDAEYNTKIGSIDGQNLGAKRATFLEMSDGFDVATEESLNTETCSLTDIVRDVPNVNANKANGVLQSLGFVIRKRGPKAQEALVFVVDRGLEFGQNIGRTLDSSKPRWYVDKSSELLEMILTRYDR